MSNSSLQVFRPYQEEANICIYNDFIHNNKCIVKMFCGTGKSLLMRKCKINLDQKLIVYVFPSLSLINQFYKDYLSDINPKNILKICSEIESTTNPIIISEFLNLTLTNKIICITYQSFKVLIDNIRDTKIDICYFDEAHHAVGETYQKLIFENDICEKQIFMTATPKNANGIVIYDRDNIQAGMCGNLVYDYSYLKGLNEGYLNPFEIAIDLYTENTNTSIYESIARAILQSGNCRVLTFHSDVNTERDTSVLNFVKLDEFKRIFKIIQKLEFPSIKTFKLTNIKMVSLTSIMKTKDRNKILADFDNTPNNQIYIISSCETIGEGIDTKNANMCVFVDARSSYVKIIQNIGRIVRKQYGVDKPNSTILIPCCVDKTKYIDCNGDREKCDEIIRQDMNQGGNFNGILNVIAALKQEDEDIYDICLNYPHSYSPQEIKSNLEKYGYDIEEPINEDGDLLDTIEYLLEHEIDFDDYDENYEDEDFIMNIADNNNVCIEIHCDSLETPIETYNSSCESNEIIRLYKSYDELLEKNIYQPIVKKVGNKRSNNISDNPVSSPKRNSRLKTSIHTNNDIKVLWKITSNLETTNLITNCIIDCEIVDLWNENFIKLKEYIDINKIRPPSCSKDKDIKILGNWLCSQLKNYKNKKYGMKNEERYTIWTSFMEEYGNIIVVDEMWNENFMKLKKYIDTNNIRPPQSSKDKDIKFLGSWLCSQLTRYKNKTGGMKNEERYNIWTSFMEEHNDIFMDVDEVWNEKFIKLKEYIDTNKIRPSDSSKNRDIKLLGSWLCHQLKKYKNKTGGMKNEERYNIWTSFMEEHNDIFMDVDEVWNENFIKLKEYIDTNKIRPSLHSKNRDIKLLGSWLCNQLQNYKNKTQGMKNEERYTIWTSFMEEYSDILFIDLDEVWNENFIKLKEYIYTNKKRPSNTSTDKDIKSLSKWLGTQLTNYKNKTNGMKNEDRYNIWTKFMEEYGNIINIDELWNENFIKLKEYIYTNKKRPSNTSTDKDIKILANWLSSQLQNYKNKTRGMKNEERYTIWTSFMEEYNDIFIDVDEVWNDNFMKLKEYIDTNKKRPSNTSTDKDIKFLATWLTCQIQNYKNKTDGMKNEERYTILTKFMEEYGNIIDVDEVWNYNFIKLKEYIDTNKIRPSLHSKDKDIKFLATWLGTQLTNYKNKTQGMNNEERYNIWTSFMEEYNDIFMDLDEVWNENFMKLKKYIDFNKLRPSKHSKDKDIKFLGNWLGTQLKNYKNKTNGMKNEERYNIWTSFMEEYNDIFSKSDDKSSLVESSKPENKLKSMKLNISEKKGKTETQENMRIRVKSEISELHKKYKTMKSTNLNNLFKEDNELWHKYHEISESNEKSFPEEDIPRNRIIQELNKIKTKRRKLIVDMGCGKAQISEYFKNDERFEFINYDHISIKESIISCDISNLPLEEDSVEICILSLVMWGSNCREYIQEANRILESNGKIYIIEPTKRWTQEDENKNIVIGTEGNKLIRLLEENGFQIVDKSIEKFCLFVGIKI
jgi:ribosomal RNA-processing protein 8